MLKPDGQFADLPLEAPLPSQVAENEMASMDRVAWLVPHLKQSSRGPDAIISILSAINALGESLAARGAQEVSTIGEIAFMLRDDVLADLNGPVPGRSRAAASVLDVFARHAPDFWTIWAGYGMNGRSKQVVNPQTGQTMYGAFYDSGPLQLTDTVTFDLSRPATINMFVRAPSPSAASSTIQPSADSYVYNVDDAGNYGRSAQMAIANSNISGMQLTMEGLMRLDLSGYSQSVDSAILRLYPETVDQGSTTHAIARVFDNSWTETGVTWSNRPTAFGANLQTWIPQAGVPVQIDLTDEVRRAVHLGDMNHSSGFDVGGSFGDRDAFELAVKDPAGYQSFYGVSTIDPGVLLRGDANRDGLIDAKDVDPSLDASNPNYHQGFFDAHGYFHPDFNLDQVVNNTDINLVYTNYATSGKSHAEGDATFDSMVDSSDLIAVYQYNTLASPGPNPPQLSLRLHAATQSSGSTNYVAYSSREAADASKRPTADASDPGLIPLDYDADGLSFGDEMNQHGTDPHDFDTDNDLLGDGFEVEATNLDPLVPNSIDADPDNDTLNNLKEQTQQTRPDDPDTDGDGTSDGAEVNQGSDPTDPSDQGLAPPGEEIADLNLLVGDFSGSQSERYDLMVGRILHQARVFGQVESADYKFRKGQTYDVRILHRGSTLVPPDYDYSARIALSANETDMIVIEDLEPTTPAITGYYSYPEATGILREGWFAGGDPAIGGPFLAERITAQLHIPRVDLDAFWPDGNELAEESEETRGLIVPLNVDDDDRDQVVDDSDSLIAGGDDDFIELKLRTLLPQRLRQLPGTLTLVFTSSKIRVWRDRNKNQQVLSDSTTFDLLNEHTLYVEGVSQSSSARAMWRSKQNTVPDNSRPGLDDWGPTRPTRSR